MRKELRGLGWRQVYVRVRSQPIQTETRKLQVCGSMLAVFSDRKQATAELRVEIAGGTLHESLSRGKLRSMKNEIFRWKIAIASSLKSLEESVVDGGAWFSMTLLI